MNQYEGSRIIIVEDNPVVEDAFAVYIRELIQHTMMVNTYTPPARF